MESSIAEFLRRQSACELLPTASGAPFDPCPPPLLTPLRGLPASAYLVSCVVCRVSIIVCRVVCGACLFVSYASRALRVSSEDLARIPGDARGMPFATQFCWTQTTRVVFPSSHLCSSATRLIGVDLSLHLPRLQQSHILLLHR